MHQPYGVKLAVQEVLNIGARTSRRITLQFTTLAKIARRAREAQAHCETI